MACRPQKVGSKRGAQFGQLGRTADLGEGGRTAGEKGRGGRGAERKGTGEGAKEGQGVGGGRKGRGTG